MASTVGCKPINMGSNPVLVFSGKFYGKQKERVAQLAEHWSSKSQVKGSTPFSFVLFIS